MTDNLYLTFSHITKTNKLKLYKSVIELIPILKVTEMMSAITANRKASRTLEISDFFATIPKAPVIRKTQKRLGKTTPAVATKEPGSPYNLYPINVAVLIAIGPGVI